MKSLSLIRARIALPGIVALFAIAGLWIHLGTPPSLLERTPFSTAYYDRDGNLLRLTRAQDGRFRLFTPLSEISPELIAATLMQEDRYFNYHPGVNPFSLLRSALETYLVRSRPMGGSTITMQVVRLRDNLVTRGIAGKLVQIKRALELEIHYSKDQILEAYLNLAPYGANIHGAGTAALIYYHQSAAALAMPQSVGLVVIPQNPVRRNPALSDATAWDQARQRLSERIFGGKIPVEITLPLTVFCRDDLPFLAPHFVEGIPDPGDGTVMTTLDSGLQSLLEARLTAWVARMQSSDIDNAAAMLVHLPTMDVVALVGSANYHDPKINGQIDGTGAPRSPGSTLKPFVYALGLEQGLIHPESLLADDPAYFAEYRPGNFDDRFMGNIPAREALALSRNVPAIALSARLKNPTLYEFLQANGAALRREESFYGLSMVVGGAETDMRNLVRLYAMLANGGIWQDLRFISGASQSSRPVLSPESALLTLTMLDRPDPAALPFSPASPFPIFWKTGTSSAFRDAWTIGVFGPYALAVWTGHFDGRPSPALVGTEAAAPLFFELVNAISTRETISDAVYPALAKLNVTQFAMENHQPGWFIPGKSPFLEKSIPQPAPEILTPRSGIRYVASRNSAEPLRIPLEARIAETQYPIFWFANNMLIGTSTDNTPLFWTPEIGAYTIRSISADGRSASRNISVIAE